MVEERTIAEHICSGNRLKLKKIVQISVIISA